jgi:hypothetical protein
MKLAMRSLFLVLLLAAAPLAAANGHEQDDDLAYVISASGQFGALNLETGKFLQFNPNVPLSLVGLARGRHHTIYGLDAANNLVTLDPATGAVTVIGNTGLPVGPGDSIALFASLANGTLFAVDFQNFLWSVNPRTGVATEIGFTGIAVPPDFAACHCVQANGLAGAENELFFSWEVADDPQNPPVTPPSPSDVPSTLYRINPHTAAVHKVGLTNTAAPIVGLGFVDDTLYGFTFGPAVGEPNKILKISRGTGKARVVTDQDPSLDPVFAAIPVQLEH